MKFRGPKAHPNRVEKPPRGVGSEPGDRQDWQRISGKVRRKSMPVLSVPGALVGGDEVTMPVFHELSVAVGMPVARHHPHRSVRALLTHTVLTSDVWTQSVPPDTDAGSRLPVRGFQA